MKNLRKEDHKNNNKKCSVNSIYFICFILKQITDILTQDVIYNVLIPATIRHFINFIKNMDMKSIGLNLKCNEGYCRIKSTQYYTNYQPSLITTLSSSYSYFSIKLIKGNFNLTFGIYDKSYGDDPSNREPVTPGGTTPNSIGLRLSTDFNNKPYMYINDYLFSSQEDEKKWLYIEKIENEREYMETKQSNYPTYKTDKILNINDIISLYCDMNYGDIILSLNKEIIYRQNIIPEFRDYIKYNIGFRLWDDSVVKIIDYTL